MKLLCINTNPILNPDGKRNHLGTGLEEGQIYETIAKPFMKNNMLCYYITGLGAKICTRFTELLDETPSKTKEEQIQEAINAENYELAAELTK